MNSSDAAKWLSLWILVGCLHLAVGEPLKVDGILNKLVNVPKSFEFSPDHLVAPLLIATILVVYGGLCIAYTCLTWIFGKKTSNLLLLNKVVKGKYRYLVTVATGRKPGSSANGAVRLQIHGTISSSACYWLNSNCCLKILGRGCVDRFLIYSCEALGTISDVSVTLIGGKSASKWYLNYIDVTELTSETNMIQTTTHFPCYQWLYYTVSKRDYRNIVMLEPGVDSRTRRIWVAFVEGLSKHHLWLAAWHPCRKNTTANHWPFANLCLADLLLVMAVNAVFINLFTFGSTELDAGTVATCFLTCGASTLLIWLCQLMLYQIRVNIKKEPKAQPCVPSADGMEKTGSKSTKLPVEYPGGFWEVQLEDGESSFSDSDTDDESDTSYPYGNLITTKAEVHVEDETGPQWFLLSSSNRNGSWNNNNGCEKDSDSDDWSSAAGSEIRSEDPVSDDSSLTDSGHHSGDTISTLDEGQTAQAKTGRSLIWPENKSDITVIELGMEVMDYPKRAVSNIITDQEKDKMLADVEREITGQYRKLLPEGYMYFVWAVLGITVLLAFICSAQLADEKALSWICMSLAVMVYKLVILEVVKVFVVAIVKARKKNK